MARVRQPFEALVGLLKPPGQPRALAQALVAIVLGDEAAQHAVEILDGLNQPEGSATSGVCGNVLDPDPSDGACQMPLRRDGLSDTSMRAI